VTTLSPWPAGRELDDDDIVRYDLGRLLLAQGRAAEAERYFRSFDVIEGGSARVFGVLGLARAEEALGKTEEAKAATLEGSASGPTLIPHCSRYATKPDRRWPGLRPSPVRGERGPRRAGSAAPVRRGVPHHLSPIRVITPRHGRVARTDQRVLPATSQVGTTFRSHLNFYFWNGRLPLAFSRGTSSRPRNPAYSRAPGQTISRGVSGADCSGTVAERQTTPDHMRPEPPKRSLESTVSCVLT
jgi:hypothetical protein